MRSLTSKTFGILAGILLIVVIALGFSMAPTVHAECTVDGTGQYCLLEPLPMGEGSVFEKYDPQITTAADYINIIIKVFISIIGALGVIMIVLGGVQYMTTDAVSKKEGGKEMISNAVFGVILALASWLILNTINPNLTDIRLEPPKGVEVTVTGKDDLPEPWVEKNISVNGKVTTVTTNCTDQSIAAAAADGVALTKGAPWASNPAIKANEDAYREKLKTVGVTVNKANCPNVGDGDCTSVYKIGDTIVSKLGEVRKEMCKNVSDSEKPNCTLVVTGASECWLHSSHHIGSGRVDLQITPKLDAYITSGGATKTCINWIPGESGDGCPVGQAGQYVRGTAVFIKESDHYHVNQW